MNLICCFETFLNGEFVQALSGINDIIHTLNEIEMDEFFKPISDACFHIVHTSQAYIMAFLEKDVKEVGHLSMFLKITHSHHRIPLDFLQML